jgi:hypothetical protein
VTLERGHLAITAGVGDAEIIGRVAILQSPDRLTTTELVVPLGHRYAVPAVAQAVNRGRGEAGLDVDPQSTDHPEPWRVTRGLRLLAVVGNASPKLITGAPALVTKAGMIVWYGRFRSDLVGVTRRGNKLRAAVVQRDPRAGNDYARAEPM